MRGIVLENSQIFCGAERRPGLVTLVELLPEDSGPMQTDKRQLAPIATSLGVKTAFFVLFVPVPIIILVVLSTVLSILSIFYNFLFKCRLPNEVRDEYIVQYLCASGILAVAPSVIPDTVCDSFFWTIPVACPLPAIGRRDCMSWGVFVPRPVLLHSERCRQWGPEGEECCATRQIDRDVRASCTAIHHIQAGPLVKARRKGPNRGGKRMLCDYLGARTANHTCGHLSGS